MFSIRYVDKPPFRRRFQRVLAVHNRRYDCQRSQEKREPHILRVVEGTAQTILTV